MNSFHGRAGPDTLSVHGTESWVRSQSKKVIKYVILSFPHWQNNYEKGVEGTSFFPRCFVWSCQMMEMHHRLASQWNDWWPIAFHHHILDLNIDAFDRSMSYSYFLTHFNFCSVSGTRLQKSLTCSSFLSLLTRRPIVSREIRPIAAKLIVPKRFWHLIDHTKCHFPLCGGLESGSMDFSVGRWDNGTLCQSRKNDFMA
jgi:hypothetical protein